MKNFIKTMNTKINLCEILKGHEGETFYSSAYGDVIYNGIEIMSGEPTIALIEQAEPKITISRNIFSNGKLSHNGECLFFPSKDQRDWNKWAEEQNKTPKTWSELRKKLNSFHLGCTASKSEMADGTERGTLIEKSALALIKIHKLIEVGYGGNVNLGYSINADDEGFNVYNTLNNYRPFAFHTKKQAEEFLSYPENIQLLKDYYMIS